jgi:hypothetical protein
MGVIRSAAPTDPDIDVLWNRIQTDFYDNQRSIVQSLDQKNALRPDLDVDRATDILWTLNHPDLWQLLVRDRGWTPTSTSSGSPTRPAHSCWAREDDGESRPRRLNDQVRALAPQLLDEPGVGPIVAAQLLVAWSHRGPLRICEALVLVLSRQLRGPHQGTDTPATDAGCAGPPRIAAAVAARRVMRSRWRRPAPRRSPSARAPRRRPIRRCRAGCPRRGRSRGSGPRRSARRWWR